MFLSLTSRASLLDDLRRHFLPVADIAGDTADAAEAWVTGDDLYVAIRVCLLARDGRYDRRHAGEAERLFGDLVAHYMRCGGYAGMSRGRVVYHAPSLVDAVEGLTPSYAVQTLSRLRVC